MDAKVVEMVNDLAARDGRTFSNMIERICTIHLDSNQPRNPNGITLREDAQEIIDGVAAQALRKGRIV